MMEIRICQEIHESDLVSEHRLFNINILIYRFDFPGLQCPRSFLSRAREIWRLRIKVKQLFFFLFIYFSRLIPFSCRIQQTFEDRAYMISSQKNHPARKCIKIFFGGRHIVTGKTI